jgi:hypothetical protein
MDDASAYVFAWKWLRIGSRRAVRQVRAFPRGSRPNVRNGLGSSHSR